MPAGVKHVNFTVGVRPIKAIFIMQGKQLLSWEISYTLCFPLNFSMMNNFIALVKTRAPYFDILRYTIYGANLWCEQPHSMELWYHWVSRNGNFYYPVIALLHLSSQSLQITSKSSLYVSPVKENTPPITSKFNQNLHFIAPFSLLWLSNTPPSGHWGRSDDDIIYVMNCNNNFFLHWLHNIEKKLTDLTQFHLLSTLSVWEIPVTQLKVCWILSGWNKTYPIHILGSVQLNTKYMCESCRLLIICIANMSLRLPSILMLQAYMGGSARVIHMTILTHCLLSCI